MSLYATIDLHSSNSVLAVMDDDGKPVLRCRRKKRDSVRAQKRDQKKGRR